jgi:hypothetical protein
LALADRVGWPLGIVVGAFVIAYVYLRARTPWLDWLHRWDALVAVAGGLALAGLERPLRRFLGAPAPAEDEAPDALPFAVRELRLGAVFIAGLSAVAFLDVHAPLDLLGPGVAALFFLRHTRRDGPPFYGILAALFVDAIVVLLLSSRGITSPSAYALPLATSAALLMHLYRDHIGSDESILRTLPPITATAVTAYEAISSRAAVAPTVAVAALGVVLVLLARFWRLRSHLLIGAGALAVALFTTITEWNARGWTAAAIALGAVTLVVPAALLRWRS